MKNAAICGLLAAVVSIALVGCTGETRERSSIVTGSVVDVDFQPVRGATVSCFGQTTTTTNTGAFQFVNVPDGEVLVSAEILVDGTVWRGRTNIYNTPNSQNSSVNLVIAPASDMAIIRGTVYDREGFVLQGASVFAYSGVAGSQRVFTNEDGNYQFNDIIAGIDYDISASGQGYRSDQTFINLNPGDNRVFDFTLDEPGIPGIDPPQNISAVTWISHTDHTRSTDTPVLRWAKDYFKSQGKVSNSSQTRAIRGDMIVETVLEWDLQQFPDLFGYGIYRGPGSTGSVSGIDLYFDPLAPYYVDAGLEPNSVYSYALSTITALYPNYANQTESQLSDRIVVETLDLLEINNVSSSLTFSWDNGSGADEFVVYVFSIFPDVAVSPMWTSNTTSSLSLQYNGPTLQTGREYYYLVLGIANGTSSRTISQIGTFVP